MGMYMYLFYTHVLCEIKKIELCCEALYCIVLLILVLCKLVYAIHWHGRISIELQFMDDNGHAHCFHEYCYCLGLAGHI